jgi:uncharacterized protein (TIGR02996 family)
VSADSPSTQREILEAALTADPDDAAAHSAYADLLIEEGDPRGEFIRTQLALESAPPGPDHDALQARSAALLSEHIEEWLGDLSGPLLDDSGVRIGFRRGWLDEIEVRTIREWLSQTIATAPETRLLRRLAVVNHDSPELDRANAYQTHIFAGAAWFEEDEEVALVPLLESPYLGNVRVFQLGDHDRERCDVGDGPVAGLIEKMPRLEELHLYLWKFEEAERVFAMSFPRLKVLRVGGVFSYPVPTLTQNASLTALEDLMLQPASPGGHQKLWPDECIELIRSPHLTSLRHLRLPFLVAGDAVCEVLPESGLLGRLRTLDLSYSQITDAGAAALAGCPDLAKLEHLDLTGNFISPEALERLRATGVALAWDPQSEPEPEGGGGGEEGDGQDLLADEPNE